MTSGFEYKMCRDGEKTGCLEITSEFIALQEVLNNSGFKGECSLKLSHFTKNFYKRHGHMYIYDSLNGKYYKPAEKKICLKIPNLVEITEQQKEHFKSMEINCLSMEIDKDFTEYIRLFVRKEYSITNNYLYITKAGEQVLENESYDINNMIDNYPKFFISSDIKIPNLKLIRETKLVMTLRGTSELYVEWPNNATTKFLPTLKKILSELKQK